MMKQKDLIAQLFKILLLFEDIGKIGSNIQENDYLGYLDRLYVFWRGMGKDDIFPIIKGLYSLGVKADHKTVKSMVFHMIDIIQKDGDFIAV